MTTTVPVRTRGDTVHALLARELRQFDVTQFFGLIGEDTVALATDLTESGVGYVATRHEGAAVAMADGYAWATGRTGVAVISRGPGLSNAATAARTASRGGRNLLIIASAAPTKGGFRPDPKGLDQAAIAAACGLAYFEARDTEGALAALHLAMASARAGRPSVLAVATDVLNGAASAVGGSAGPLTSPAGSGSPAAVEPDGRAAPSPQDVARVLDVLRECSRPLVLAGRGAVESGAKAALEDLAHQIGAVLGTTMLAKDLFRGHPSDIGVVGGFTSDPRGRCSPRRLRARVRGEPQLVYLKPGKTDRHRPMYPDRPPHRCPGAQP